MLGSNDIYRLPVRSEIGKLSDASLRESAREEGYSITAHPVLHASLSMLIESAVMMKASAHARCPKCGLGSVKKICSA